MSETKFNDGGPASINHVIDFNDGGPAFPSSPVFGPNAEVWRPTDIGCEGMTLWDYYAAHAPMPPNDGRAYHVPTYCANHADAMLAERAKRFGTK